MGSGDAVCEAYTGSLAGRVIEPRNRSHRGSRRCDKSGRHHRRAEMVWRDRFRRGRRAGHAGTGRAGTWEVSTSPTEAAVRAPRYKQPRPGGAAQPLGSEAGQPEVPPSEGRRSAAGRASRSRSPLIVLLKSGNSPHGDPAEGSGGSDQGLPGGQTPWPPSQISVSTEVRQVAGSRWKWRLMGARVARSDTTVRGAGCLMWRTGLCGEVRPVGGSARRPAATSQHSST